MSIDYDKLLSEATQLHNLLLEAAANMPKRSIQRNETRRLASAIHIWCYFVEDNSEHWKAQTTSEVGHE